jgi:hypothetical protein
LLPQGTQDAVQFPSRNRGGPVATLPRTNPQIARICQSLFPKK